MMLITLNPPALLCIYLDADAVNVSLSTMIDYILVLYLEAEVGKMIFHRLTSGQECITFVAHLLVVGKIALSELIILNRRGMMAHVCCLHSKLSS